MIDKVYKYFKDHWIISTFIITIPTYWFSLIKLVGDNIGLVDNGKLNFVGIVISSIIFIVSLGFTFIKNYKDNQENTKNSQENTRILHNQIILQKVLSSVNSICSRKSYRYIEFIKQYREKKDNIEPFDRIAQPKSQIMNIMEEIKICFSDILGMERDKIGVSIIYKDNIENKWSWFHKIGEIEDLSLNEIIENPRSTARQLIDGRKNILFFPEKNKGADCNSYTPSKADESFNLAGSILCKKIDVTLEDEKFIDAILSITTYGNLMCQCDDEEAKHTITNIILPPYEQRLKLELALYYIKSVIKIQ